MPVLKKSMIIPKVADWVECEGRDSHGKVIFVDEKNMTFRADFFIQDESKFDSCIECDMAPIPFSQIERIVSDKKLIEELDEEYYQGRIPEE